jgi:excisionase family DNA binding protein
MRPQNKPPRPPSLRPQLPDHLPAPPAAEPPDGDGLVLLLSVEDAGRALGVSRSTVYELIGSGDLEVVHVRRSVRVPVDALHDFVRRLRSDRTVSETQADRTLKAARL